MPLTNRNNRPQISVDVFKMSLPSLSLSLFRVYKAQLINLETNVIYSDGS